MSYFHISFHSTEARTTSNSSYDVVISNSVFVKSWFRLVNVRHLCYNMLYIIMQFIIQVVVHFQIIKNLYFHTDAFTAEDSSHCLTF